MIKLVISQTAISKSICGNLNRRLKNRGMRMRPSFRRDEEGTGPKDETFELFLGREIVGFILRQRGRVVARGRRVEMSRRDNKQQRHGLGHGSAALPATFDVTMQVRVYPALAMVRGSRAASELWRLAQSKVVQTSHPSLLVLTVAFLVILLLLVCLCFRPSSSARSLSPPLILS